MADEPNSRDLVQSLARGLTVLKSFTSSHSMLSVSEVSELTGITRAAVRRLLITLEDLGYVRSEYQRYTLRPKVLELGYSYLSSLYPWDNAMPVMQEFSTDIDENCLAGVFDDGRVVCVARTTRRSVPIAVAVGGRLPAYASSMGRVLLAGLSDELLDAYLRGRSFRAYTPQTLTSAGQIRDEIARVREQGWSLIENELEPDVVGLAAPIRGYGGQVVAALNVSTHEHRLDAKELTSRVLPKLLERCSELGLLFGGHP